jgi:anti-sigma-K factor RskA
VNNDVHTLTGAYVLDALSEMERRAFEDHMAGCGACSQEVAELRETTARLGLATALNPPPQLWNKVRTATTQVRQLPPVSADRGVVRSKSWATRVSVFAAAASLLVAAGIGVAWVTTNSDLKDQVAASQQELTKLKSVLSAPDAKVGTANIGASGNATVAISLNRNEMVVLVQGLPPLPANKVYQAWFVNAGKPAAKPASAGLLGVTDGTMTSDDVTAAQGATALAFTLEPAGGSKEPSQAPLAQVNFSA